MLAKIFLDPPLRQIRSIWDYFAFFEFGLSKKPKLWVTIVILGPLLSIAIAKLGPRLWTILPILGLTMVVAMPILNFVKSRIGPNRVKLLELHDNTQLVELSDKLKPVDSDALQGFKNVKKRSGFDSSIHLSVPLNQATFQIPNWDCHIQLDTKNTRQEAIISNIRSNARFYRRYGLQTTKKQFLKKALINEKKVGIASDLTTDMTSIKLFATDYYSTLCTGERALSDFSENLSGKRQVTCPAKTRIPFDLFGKPARLNPLSAENPPMTNQIGVSLLGITQDNYFAVCVQSRKALQSAGKRAPLASGSADLQDYEAGDSIKSFIERSALRELVEEWGNNRSKARTEPLQSSKLMHLGMFRIPKRGGKPEFVVFAKLNWTAAELMPDSSEVEKYVAISDKGTDEVEFRTDTLDSLERAVSLLLRHSGAVEDSASLYGSLLCLQSAIEAHPDAILEIIQS